MESLLGYCVTKSKNELEMMDLEQQQNNAPHYGQHLLPPDAGIRRNGQAEEDGAEKEADENSQSEIMIRCDIDVDGTADKADEPIQHHENPKPAKVHPSRGLYRITSQEPAPSASYLRLLRDSCDLLLVGGACTLLIEIFLVLVVAFQKGSDGNNGTNTTSSEDLHPSVFHVSIPETIFFPIFDIILMVVAIVNLTTGVAAVITHRQRSKEWTTFTKWIATVGAVLSVLPVVLLIHRAVMVGKESLWFFVTVLLVEELFAILNVVGSILSAHNSFQLGRILVGKSPILLRRKQIG